MNIFTSPQLVTFGYMVIFLGGRFWFGYSIVTIFIHIVFAISKRQNY